MVLERQGVQPIREPSERIIARDLRRLRSYGRSSYASLTAPDGSWVQVGGGGVGCLLERRAASTSHVYRAWKLAPHLPADFDGVELRFGGGIVALRREEWFHIDQVIEAFVAFRAGVPFPEYIRWRDITEQLVTD